ncbi:MAG: hypothetical protein ACQEQF_00480 [Bacillota bacterium]
MKFISTTEIVNLFQRQKEIYANIDNLEHQIESLELELKAKKYYLKKLKEDKKENQRNLDEKGF